MEIIHKEKYGIFYVIVGGITETELNPEFEFVIRNVLGSDSRRVLLDLGALRYLRSSALRVILDVIKEINRKKGKIVLCSLNLYVNEIFESNNSEDFITIADSVESGLRVLQRPFEAAGQC